MVQSNGLVAVLHMAVESILGEVDYKGGTLVVDKTVLLDRN